MSYNETRINDLLHIYNKAIIEDNKLRAFRSTPFIITFGKTNITEFDIHSYIELGLRVVRFKVSNVPNSDRIKLLELLNKALKWYCMKYDVLAWPIAISIDIPNACIRSGILANREVESIFIKGNSSVEVTCDLKYLTQCDEHRIFIDDPYTLPSLVPGTEITINFGEIVLFSSEIIDDKNIKCKVVKGGNLVDVDYVCFRGIKHLKPSLTKKDMEILDFAKNYQFDIININSVRTPETIRRIRSFFKDPKPLLVSTICEQEGLDNIDAIIEASDGIVLARDFVHHEILNKYKIVMIQLQITAKCRQRGKPFFMSGNILEGAVVTGMFIGSDLNDITNAVLKRTGFVLRQFKDPTNLVKTMRSLDHKCRGIEWFTHHGHEFRRLLMEYKMPVDAAQACVLATILLAKITQSLVIFVLTVTGRTVKQLVHMADNIIVAITSSPTVARQLQLFHGVVAIIYEKKALRVWENEMQARIKFAVEYGMKFEILERDSHYVVLRKSYPSSSYCDHITACQALTDEDRLRLECTRKKTVMSMINLNTYN